MADTKISALTAGTPALTDTFPLQRGGTANFASSIGAIFGAFDIEASGFIVGDGSDGVVAKTLAETKTLLGVDGLNSGWVLVTDSWAYASATTITVPSGAAAIYSVGDKIKITQATVKYFYVVGVADTVLTVTGGSEYSVVSAAITSVYLSKEATPVGFPQWFSLTAPTWTTSGTAFTNQPATNSAKFQIAGRVLSVSIRFTMNATSGGTGRFIATFTAGELPAFVIASAGSVFNYNTFLGGTSWTTTTQNVVSCSKYDGTALATNSEICALFINVVI